MDETSLEEDPSAQGEADSHDGPRSFLDELKRRRVGRVGVAYTGVALGVLEIGDLASAGFSLDERLYSVMVIAAVAGFPIVLFLSWVFDLTPEGIERTRDVEPEAVAGTGGGGPPGRYARQLVTIGAIVVLAMTGIGWRYMPNDRVDLVEDRVAVASFRNISGDRELDHHGIIVASHIRRSLDRIDGFSVAPPDLASVPGEVTSESGSDQTLGSATALAEGTRSRFVIGGEYYLDGGDLVVQAQVYDATKHEVVFNAAPVRLAPDNPNVGFPDLLDGLFGFMATLGRGLTRQEVEFALQTRAPSYAASKQYALAMELMFVPFIPGYEEAATLLDSAIALDSTYVSALFARAELAGYRGGAAGVDILSRLSSMRSDLTPYERATADYLAARAARDNEGGYRAAAQAAELVGVSYTYYLAGTAAQDVHRPNEAIDYYLQYDRERRPHPQIWISTASAFHQAGAYRRGLRFLRTAPTRLLESGFGKWPLAAAMAARGQGDDLLEELGPDLEGVGTSFVFRIMDELDAHGTSQAHTVALRLLDRERTRPEGERPTGVAWGRILSYAGQTDEALAVFKGIVDLAPEDGGARLEAAILSAEAGDAEYAESAITWFAEIGASYPQAQIAGALGDGARAVRFLEEAERQGAVDFANLHGDRAFREIRGHPVFEEYLKPRG